MDAIEGLPAIQTFLEEVEAGRRNGRPGYSPRVMLRALALRYLISERHVSGFIERLERSPELRDARGFGDALPSNSAFSRFFRLLSERADLLEQAIAGVVDELKERLPDMAREVAVDSTDIESCANPRRARVRDPDAAREFEPARTRLRERGRPSGSSAARCTR